MPTVNWRHDDLDTYTIDELWTNLSIRMAEMEALRAEISTRSYTSARFDELIRQCTGRAYLCSQIAAELRRRGEQPMWWD